MTTRGEHTRRRASEVGASIARAWHRLLEIEWLWIGLWLLTGMAVLFPAGHGSRVHPGEIAQRAWIANRDLLWQDHDASREKKEQARAEVLNVYDFEPDAARGREDELSQLFELGRSTLTAEESTSKAAIDAWIAGSHLKVTPGQIGVLRQHEFSSDLEERLKGVISQVLRQGVVASKAELLENHDRGIMLRDLARAQEVLQLDLYRYLGYPQEAREVIEAETRRWLDFERRERAALQELLLANVSPNLHANRSETLVRREAAAAATPDVVQRISAGQVIVRKGDEIDAVAARFINEMLGGKGRFSFLLPTAGQLLLLALCILALWAALQREEFADRASRARTFACVVVVLASSLICLRFSVVIADALGGFFQTAPFNSAELYLYAIPYASVALVCFLLCGRSVALIAGLVFAIESGQFVDRDAWSIVLYALVGSLAAIYFLDQVKRRSTILRAGLLIGVVNVVVVVVVSLLLGEGTVDIEQLGLGMAAAFMGGLLVAAVAGFTVPVFEWLLPLTTDITLVELSNTNLPLLRRLALEAPGTFQHSLMVANLAKGGCAAIGADAVLAYTASLYHDIGKVKRPEYFIENQRGQNLHDALQPDLSAQIVISHVADGLELAREARLPGPLLDAIAQHHGTHVLTYFHNRAIEANGGRAVEETPFRYPGPKANNRVIGVLMLADAVEAASRTLENPTTESIKDVVDQIFESHARSGELDDTRLTLGELKLVAEEFQRVLDTFHHRRVDYPGFDFRARSARGPLRVVGS